MERGIKDRKIYFHLSSSVTFYRKNNLRMTGNLGLLVHHFPKRRSETSSDCLLGLCWFEVFVRGRTVLSPWTPPPWTLQMFDVSSVDI